MLQNLYDLNRIVDRAREWRRQAEASTIPEMRAFCFEEARRCEAIVEQSLLTPPLVESGAE
jgi:hypothetical protein